LVFEILSREIKRKTVFTTVNWQTLKGLAFFDRLKVRERSDLTSRKT